MPHEGDKGALAMQMNAAIHQSGTLPFQGNYEQTAWSFGLEDLFRRVVPFGAVARFGQIGGATMPDLLGMLAGVTKTQVTAEDSGVAAGQAEDFLTVTCAAGDVIVLCGERAWR